jgi:UDP-2,4-diacetamido-2,4,6-trideoxy-beta-L-altropyranose hydrolase
MAASTVVFRADASVTIGTGHVIRCLALADALKSRGVDCHFVCREQTGNLLDSIQGRGHVVHPLTGPPGGDTAADWSVDARRSGAVLEALQPDWLVVDHYELGQGWERQIRPSVGRLMAIDDIGRPHLCDVLLDQNFPNPMHGRYGPSATGDALLLLGPQFALVRPEFAALRPFALSRRDGSLRRVLVSMGGSDPEGETTKALTGLAASSGGSQWAVDVVVGAGNPHRRSVEEACARLPNARLHVQTSRMADLMAAADCAITAGGSTSWERCCLGLPALVTAVSPDQLAIAESLADAGVQVFMGRNSGLTSDDYAAALGELTAAWLREMSACAAEICDGRGVERVAERLQS